MKFAKNALLTLTSKGKISQVIENLNIVILQIKDEDLKNDIIMLSANYEQLESSIRKGVISSQEVIIERNKITAGLIQVINLLADKINDYYSTNNDKPLGLKTKRLKKNNTENKINNLDFSFFKVEELKKLFISTLNKIEGTVTERKRYIELVLNSIEQNNPTPNILNKRIQEIEKIEEEIYSLEIKKIYIINLINNKSAERLIKNGELNIKDIQEYVVPLKLKDLSFIKAFDTRKFVGREDNVKKILKQVLTKNEIGVTGGINKENGLIGIGGVGKTAIVSFICEQIMKSWEDYPTYPKYLTDIFNGKRYFEDGILFIRFEAQEPLAVLIEEKIEKQIGYKVEHSSFAPSKKLEILKNVLKYHDILIVLDSAEQNKGSFEEIRNSFRGLPILVTSREKLLDISYEVIEAMNEGEAMELFQKHYLERISKKDEINIDKVFKNILGYLPLAIMLLAKWGYKKRKSINQIIDSAKSMWLEIEVEDKSELENKNRNVLVCFRLTFDNLTESQKSLFYRCGIFDISFNKKTISQILDGLEVEFDLDVLVEHGLSEKEMQAELYTLHPVIREISRHLATKEGIIDELYENTINYYHKTEPTELRYDDFDQIKEFLVYCNNRGKWQNIISFNDKYENYFHVIGMWETKIYFNDSAIFAAEQLSDNHRKLKIFQSKSDTLARLNKSQESINLLNEIIKLNNTISLEEENKKSDLTKQLSDFWSESSNINYLWHSYYLIGTNMYELGNHSHAFEWNNRELRKCLIIGNENSISFARTNGWIYTKYGLFNKAADIFVVNIQSEFIREAGNSNKIKSIHDWVDLMLKKMNINEAEHILLKLEDIVTKNNINQTKEGLTNEDQLSYLGKLIELQFLKSDYRFIQSYIDRFESLAKFMWTIENNDAVAIHKGRFSMANNQKEESFINFEKIEDEWLKKFYHAKCLLHFGTMRDFDINLLQQIQDLLSYWGEKKNIYEISKVNELLCEFYVKTEKWQEAIKLNRINENIKQKIGIVPINEINTKQIILEKSKFGEEIYTLIESQYNAALNLQYPNFFDINSDSKIIGKDGKEMLLIPSSSCSFQDDEFEKFSILDFFQNFIDYWVARKKIASMSEKIYLYSFYIDRFPVTVGEYKKFCETTNYKISQEYTEINDKSYKENNKQNSIDITDIVQADLSEQNSIDITSIVQDDLSKPITGISYSDAENYAKWAGKFLPNKAEWEKVFRKSNQSEYLSELAKGNESVKFNSILFFTTAKEYSTAKFFTFLLGENIYNEISLHRNYDNIDFQDLLSKTDILTVKTGITALEEIFDSSHNVINSINIVRSLRLIAYSQTLSNYKSKAQLMQKMKTYDIPTLIKCVSILFKESVKYYFLYRELDYIQYAFNEKSNWELSILSMMGTDVELPTSIDGMGEYIKEKQICILSSIGDKQVFRYTNTNDKKLDSGFRCVIPVFTNELNF